MKSLAQLAVAAALVAGAAADVAVHAKHQHLHRAHHAKAEKRAEAAAAMAELVPNAVEKRDVVVVTTTVTPVATKYVYSNGDTVAAAEAKQCISDGECIVVGKSTPTTTPKGSTSTKKAGEFYESKTKTATKAAAAKTKSSSTSSTTSSSSSLSTSTSTSTSTSSTSTSSTSTSSTSTSTSSSSSTSTSTSASSTAKAAAPTAAPAAAAGGGGSFPSGQVPCSQFPSAYGALAVSWVGLGGWASIQKTGSWTPGASISYIEEPITGPCIPGSFCSYACPPGQTKTQWPVTSQGSTGQSIGGLWCNSEGFLEITNPAFDTLCMDGLGGITIQNDLSSQACVCGTNYPGNEMMNVPLVTQPGGSYPLTNLNAKVGYQWQGKYTSGQFYVNNAGVSVDQACIWTSSKYPSSAGNWAPVNIGAGTDINGITYLSIFANQPTSTALLNFNIEIKGDITAPCYLKGGSYYGGGNGCTVSYLSRLAFSLAHVFALLI